MEGYKVEDLQLQLWKSMYEIWVKGHLCDAVIQTKDGEIKVHRLIMTSCSPFFSSVNKCHTNGTTVYSYDLSDERKEIVFVIIKMLYTGYLDISLENVKYVQKLCELLDLEKPISVCKHFQETFEDGTICVLASVTAVDASQPESLEKPNSSEKEETVDIKTINNNIKETTKTDLYIAEQLVNMVNSTASRRNDHPDNISDNFSPGDQCVNEDGNDDDHDPLYEPKDDEDEEENVRVSSTKTSRKSSLPAIDRRKSRRKFSQERIVQEEEAQMKDKFRSVSVSKVNDQEKTRQTRSSVQKSLKTSKLSSRLITKKRKAIENTNKILDEKKRRLEQIDNTENNTLDQNSNPQIPLENIADISSSGKAITGRNSKNSMTKLAKEPEVCSECGEQFVSKLTLKRHRMKQHSTPKANFVSPEDDLKRNTTHHKTSQSFKCVVCKQTFPSPILLAEHVQTAHPELQCQTCGQSFGTKAELTKHGKSHMASSQKSTDKNLIKCRLCKEFFKKGNYLGLQ